jgi:dodecin
MAKNKDKSGKSSSRTYKLIELVGTSKTSYEDAIETAIAEASETLDGLDWFQVTEFRGAIQGGRIAEYQAIMKVGFKVLR